MGDVTGAFAAARALSRVADDVSDLAPAFADAGAELVATAQGLAPVETGALVRSIRAQVSAVGLVVEAGAGLTYAAVQNSGSVRGVEGTGYFDRAEADAEGTALRAIETRLDRSIRAAGLS